MSENQKCPKCEGEMRTRVNKQTGIEFLGCSSYPKCNGTRQLGCPQCGESMVKRVNKSNQEEFLGCSKYPACRGTRRINKQGDGTNTVALRGGDRTSSSTASDADDIADLLSREEDDPF